MEARQLVMLQVASQPLEGQVEKPPAFDVALGGKLNQGFGPSLVHAARLRLQPAVGVESDVLDAEEARDVVK